MWQNVSSQLDLQIMSAERDFLEAKLRRGRTQQEGLVANLQALRRQLLAAGINPKVAAVRLQDLDDDLSNSDTEPQTDEDDSSRHPLPPPDLHYILPPTPFMRLKLSLQYYRLRHGCRVGLLIALMIWSLLCA